MKSCLLFRYWLTKSYAHLHLYRDSINLSLCSLGALAVTMKGFDTRAREVNAKEGNPAKWIGACVWKTCGQGGSIRKENSRGLVGQTKAKGSEREGRERKRKNSSLERILSYTIQVRVPSRARHRKALKSPLKMTASLLTLAGKGIRGSTSGLEDGSGDCSQDAAPAMAIR